MSRRVLIRSAIVDDAQGILKTHSAAVHRTASRQYASDILTAWAAPFGADNVRRMAGIVASQSELVLIAEIGANIVGFGSIVAKNIELRAIYVTRTLGVTPKHPLLFGGCGGLGEAAARTKANRIANEQESTETVRAMRGQFSREMKGVLGSYFFAV